jgi:hypothetical protein
MMRSNASFPGLLQLRNLVAQPSSRHLGEPLAVLFPVHDRFYIARPEAPKSSVATEANLMLASSNTF